MPDETKNEIVTTAENPPEPEKEETPPPSEVVEVNIEEQTPPTLATWAQKEKEELYERLGKLENSQTKKEERPEPELEPEPEPVKKRGLRYKRKRS